MKNLTDEQMKQWRHIDSTHNSYLIDCECECGKAPTNGKRIKTEAKMFLEKHAGHKTSIRIVQER